jgi:hypothetical protein
VDGRGGGGKRERGRETGNEDGMRERERETGERKLREKVGVLFQERETKQRGKTTDTPIAKAT